MQRDSHVLRSAIIVMKSMVQDRMEQHHLCQTFVHICIGPLRLEYSSFVDNKLENIPHLSKYLPFSLARGSLHRKGKGAL